MGQAHSSKQPAQPSAEELSRCLAQRFADQSFSGVELYSFKDNFRTLADVHKSKTSRAGLLYWSEDTLIKFLAIPDCLEVGAILFCAASYIGAFPFPSLAPVVLDFEALVKVVVILTGRYKSVIRRRPDSLRLLFRSLAVYDRGVHQEGGGNGGMGKEKGNEVDVDVSLEDKEGEGGEDEDEDDLSLAALDALDAIEAFGHAEKLNIHHARIPLDIMRKLIAFLLAIAPLRPSQPVADFSDRLTPDALTGVRGVGECILRGFRCKDEKGVLYSDFKPTIKKSLPYMFTPLEPLFEHLLFSKNVDMSIATPSNNSGPPIPLLSTECQIMDLNLLGQISFFIPGTHLWHRLRLLYAGSETGFSMGSVETKVLKWAAPTLLLVSGIRIPFPVETHAQQAFLDRIPLRCIPKCPVETFTQGLLRRRRVFDLPAGTCARDDGIGFGSPMQKLKNHCSQSYLNLGPVSLTFGHSLEYGIFQNTGGGGAYNSTGDEDYYTRDVFEIEEIEVWGCGGDSEAETEGSGVGGTGSAGAQADYAWEGSWGGQGFGGRC
ncbi:unnamed protein product [Tuber melanosporum]|uniref:(Perigord truffle) hypothetical protein n=1 Tax=Tuber melanosporum (strain Mel28) TaxID=656061 RepID=D5GA39_TUBMM|nr:uncharacterized protein GSTUM_00003529001 [Tuber melanosporum]CAZ81382.1 unnamed protein product [Tuber melanosporum]